MESRVKENQQEHPQVPHQGGGIDEEKGDEKGKLQAWGIGESHEDELCHFCAVLHQCHLTATRWSAAARKTEHTNKETEQKLEDVIQDRLLL